MLQLLLTGCVDLNAHADAMAKLAGMQRDEITVGPFVLTAFYRITRSDLPLTIYIEGDGFAWRSRNEPSDDPTPHKALGLALAAADPAANVVYLARPCQFTPMTANPRCDAAYWTGKRYAEEVVAAMNQAVTHYVKQTSGQRIALVGYSGGGALAVLIAARRNDVATLRTVAGNLDHLEINRLHKVSAMPKSLNAIDVAHQIAGIPQIHFSGASDATVPPSIAIRFAAAAGGNCTQTRIVDGMSHDSDWARQWPSLLALSPRCNP
ncbi:MAG: alpha/beta hydrolase family protein [Burkholderiaceae bacterium]